MLWIPIVGLLAIGGLVWGLHKPTTKQVCVIDECPSEIHDADTGSGYVYRVTSRFMFVLDATKYPPEDLSIVCDPQGTIGSISNIPAVEPPLYATRFEAVKAGTCIVTNNDFRVSVRVKATD